MQLVQNARRKKEGEGFGNVKKWENAFFRARSTLFIINAAKREGLILTYIV